MSVVDYDNSYLARSANLLTGLYVFYCIALATCTFK